jgi:hypothetical protein
LGYDRTVGKIEQWAKIDQYVGIYQWVGLDQCVRIDQFRPPVKLTQLFCPNPLVYHEPLL